MQSQGTKPKSRMRGTGKLSLDSYLSFTDRQMQIDDLSVSLLEQVISMHGFKKVHPSRKKNLIDAVSSIDLMDPCRSTLNDENVSSSALMTLEEAIKDLAELNWQECCVTSIQTVNSVKHDMVHPIAKASSSKSKPKGSTKRRKLSTQEGVDGDRSSIDAARGSGGFVGSHAVCSSAKHDMVHPIAKASSSKSKPKGSTKRRKLSTQEASTVTDLPSTPLAVPVAL
ncbi:hypothetical protein U1Q18_024714 [Sarracenia purpurea var. burkii]